MLESELAVGWLALAIRFLKGGGVGQLSTRTACMRKATRVLTAFRRARSGLAPYCRRRCGVACFDELRFTKPRALPCARRAVITRAGIAETRWAAAFGLQHFHGRPWRDRNSRRRRSRARGCVGGQSSRVVAGGELAGGETASLAVGTPRAARMFDMRPSRPGRKPRSTSRRIRLPFARGQRPKPHNVKAALLARPSAAPACFGPSMRAMASKNRARPRRLGVLGVSHSR